MRCYDIPADPEQQRAFGRDFLDRLGGQRLYLRLSLRGPRQRPDIARELGFSDHTGAAGFHRFYRQDPQLRALCESDRRALQWFSNGAISTQRETHFGASYACFSRYATRTWEIVTPQFRQRARAFLHQTPAPEATNAGPLVMITGPGEPSLLETGQPEGLIADYSPFAIAEFRDWLTHRGRYAAGGPYAGEGRAGGEAFADDPAPDQARGDHATFNQTYGTGFATWTLRYWDPERFPDPLPLDADGMPAPGEPGGSEGGFDAPREARPDDPLWRAWHSEGPAHPGFRQLMVRHYTADIHRLFREEGVPRERIFASVIAHDDQPWHQRRRFVDADPYWVAGNPHGNPGFTMYGSVCRAPGVFEQIISLSEADPPNWGLSEWHAYPLPPGLYTATAEQHRQALDLLWSFRPHYVEIEGWTGLRFGGHWGYETRDTHLEWALREWLAALPDQPYFDRRRIDYAPPPVRALRVEPDRRERTKVAWSPLIWDGLDYAWSDWREFSHFQVYGSQEETFDPARATLLVRTVASEVSLAGAGAGCAHYHVLAVKKAVRR